MVIKIDVNDKDLEVIEDELSMLIDECKYQNTYVKQLKQDGFTEKEIAECNDMNIGDYRRFCHRNHVMKKLFESILNGMNE